MPTILVIEDEAGIRENIVATLEFEDFQILVAENGDEGLILAREHHPDLILCDVMMPKLDGYQLLHFLRDDPATNAIPFIFLTARVDRSDIRQGMHLGADDYLTKPFTRDELLSAINSRLKRHTGLAQHYEHQLEQAKETLIRMVAHELRTPLVSINMVHDIITRRLGQMTREELEQMLEMMGAGRRRLTHVVEQMVLLTQLDAGILTADSINEHGAFMQLWELLTVSIEQARRFATRNGDITIYLDDRDNNSYVQCDTAALKHALAEIFTNAIHFSPQDGTVDASQWQAGDRVWISITDHGAGISHKQIQLAEQAFQQVNRASQEQQGVGIGLPLARRIIEIHHGTLELKSVEGKGTQVVISLPVAEKPSA